MSTDKKYNGWTNYETWCVNLWIGADSSNYWNETALEIYNESEADTTFSRVERAALDLADRLKSEIEESLSLSLARQWRRTFSARQCRK